MMEIINEKPVCLAEVKEILNKNDVNSLSFEQKNALDHASTCAKLSLKEAKELEEKIKSLNLRTVKDEQIVQIIDILPRTIEDINIIFKNVSIKPSEMDIKEILKIVGDYVKE